MKMEIKKKITDIIINYKYLSQFGASFFIILKNFYQKSLLLINLKKPIIYFK
jgi:hypothetical protein